MKRFKKNDHHFFWYVERAKNQHLTTTYEWQGDQSKNNTVVYNRKSKNKNVNPINITTAYNIRTPNTQHPNVAQGEQNQSSSVHGGFPKIGIPHSSSSSLSNHSLNSLLPLRRGLSTSNHPVEKWTRGRLLARGTTTGHDRYNRRLWGALARMWRRRRQLSAVHWWRRGNMDHVRRLASLAYTPFCTLLLA